MKKKAKTRGKFIKELDVLFSKIVRESSSGKCDKCGSRLKVQCAHVFSRHNMSVRWDFDNALPLCWRCHFWWAHKEPIQFNDFVAKKLGAIHFNLLKARVLRIKKWEQWELLALRDELKHKLRGQNDTRID